MGRYSWINVHSLGGGDEDGNLVMMILILHPFCSGVIIGDGVNQRVFGIGQKI